MAVDPASALLRYFEYDHLPEGPLRDTSREIADLAHKLTAYLPRNAEQTTGLRKLLEAKDCFVRAALDLPIKDIPNPPAEMRQGDTDLTVRTVSY